MADRCPTFQGIWAAAREHFALFQLAARPGDLPEGFSDRRGGHFAWAYRIGEVGIVAPDLRSERSREPVLGDAGRRAFPAALASMADCRQLLLVSTVPLVQPASDPARAAASTRCQATRAGRTIWSISGRARRAGREGVGGTCSACWSTSRPGTGVCRVTSLSGEIHLGALGVIQSGATEIYQLTSSGIVHPPPSARGRRRGWSGSARGPTRLAAPTSTARLLPLPGPGRRFLRARNWLELELPGGDALTATWHSEGPSGASRLSLGQPAADTVTPLRGRFLTEPLSVRQLLRRYLRGLAQGVTRPQAGENLSRQRNNSGPGSFARRRKWFRAAGLRSPSQTFPAAETLNGRG